MSKKPIIGIVATSNYMLTNDTFKDTYRYGNNYIKKIVENGGVPFLIPLCDNKVIMDSIEMCDGLILPGGDRVLESSFEIVDYFYKNKKPILGICLGLQTLGMYSSKLDDPDKIILKKIDNGVDHWPYEITRDNNDVLAHKIDIVKDTKLYGILKKDEIEVNSVHHSTIKEVGSKFRVSAYSNDGLIEGIEVIDDSYFCVGVQFHPEILPQYNDIFKIFINSCKK